MAKIVYISQKQLMFFGVNYRKTNRKDIYPMKKRKRSVTIMKMGFSDFMVLAYLLCLFYPFTSPLDASSFLVRREDKMVNEP